MTPDDNLLVASIRVVLRDPRPVSANHLYSQKGPKRFLTSAGRKFKGALTSEVSRACLLAKDPSWNDAVDIVYKHGGSCSLIATIYLDDLMNQSWDYGGSTLDSGKPRSPYNRKDADGFLKIICDAVKDGTGIDDCCNLDVISKKREDKTDPRVEVVFEVFE